MKWILLLAVSAIAGTGFVLSQDGDLRWPGTAAGDSRAAGKRKSASLLAHNERRLIFASGLVEGKHRSVELTFEVEGRIESIEVREGQPVTAGQPLARLDADVWQTRLEAAQAELALAQARRLRLVNAASAEARTVAQAQLRVAEVRAEQTAREFDRAFELRKQGAITSQQWDEIQHQHSVALAEAALARAQAAEVSAAVRADDLQVADAQIGQARAAVRQAAVMLEKAVLKCPCDGIVLRVNAEPGELIAPDRSQSILTITNLDEIRVRAYVEELDALAVTVGAGGYVTAEGRPGHRYEAAVVEVGPAMHPKHFFSHKPGERVDVKVREVVLRLADASDVVVGLPVEVFIEPRNPMQNTPHESDSTQSPRPSPRREAARRDQ